MFLLELTIIGIMQGDCLSAVLFIFYLAQALEERNDTEAEHSYSKRADETPARNTIETEHSYAEIDDTAFSIEPKYADDITYVSTSKRRNETIEEIVPKKLKKHDLGVNAGKTERYTCPDPPNTTKSNSWKSCKLLGSMIDTESDITRRKSLALAVMKDKSRYYKSKNLSIKQKIRHFNTYVMSVLLYNCELWTLTKTLNDKLDAFHRRLLRYAIGAHYPKIIKNEDIYIITEAIPLSNTIKRRRLSWFGHLMRLPKETPARQAFAEAIGPKKRKRGRPKTIWLDVIQRDLKDIGIEIEVKDPSNIPKLESLCIDRTAFRHLVNSNTCLQYAGKSRGAKNSSN